MTTVYIAIQSLEGHCLPMKIEAIKTYMRNMYKDELEFVLPTEGYQKGWDDIRTTNKHRQAFQLLQGADDCNGMFEKGADVIVIQHSDPAMVGLLVNIMHRTNDKRKVIFYNGNHEFDDLVN